MKPISGAVTALGTPLDDDENLHEEGLRRHLQTQIDAGVDAVLLLGSMGAMQLMKDETFRRALEVATGEVDGKLPVIVGCGDTSTARTAARIRWAEQHAVNGVALVPPYFFMFTEAELCEYFKELAAGTELPVYLYGNPLYTKHTMSYELIAELSEVDNIVGLKESGDLLTLRRCAERFGASDDFAVLSGLTPFFDVSLQLGADGIVDGLFAIAPEYAVDLVRCHHDGDADGVAAARRNLLRLLDVVAVDSVFGGFTAAMNLRGVPGDFTPRPFTKITEAGREQVQAILEELELAPFQPR